MTMIGRDDQQRLIPVAVLIDPVGDSAYGRITAEDGPDRIVEIVVMVGPINIPGLNQ